MNFIGIFGIDPEWIWAGGTLVGFLLLAILFSIGSRRFLKKLLKTKTSLDEVFAEAIRGLVVWALILGGAYAAVLHVSAVLQDTIFWPFVGQCFTIAWILLAIRTAIKVLNAISHWKIDRLITVAKRMFGT